jgi:CheY-like chemotaxis protein
MSLDKSILVVEDHADTRNVMRTLLETEGYRVICAANGLEALEGLHNGEPPCLILLDLNMPVMDGLRFGQEMRRDPEMLHIALVVISADENLTEVAASLGAAGYCSKPVNIDWLLETIHRLCV